jgi:hypothetical protein
VQKRIDPRQRLVMRNFLLRLTQEQIRKGVACSGCIGHWKSSFKA